MKEEWRDIKGYEGYYQVSNLGNVRALKREVKHNDNTKQIKKAKTKALLVNQKNEYIYVHLYKNGKCKAFRVHRLVGIMFIPNHQNKPQINHIDLNKKNNRVENLEWCTAQENTHHAHQNRKINTAKGSRLPQAKLKEKEVKEIRTMLKKGCKNKDICKLFNVSPPTITAIKKRIVWKHVL